MLGLIRLLIITQIVRSIPLQKGLPNSADDSSSYAVGPSKDTGSKPQSDTGGPSPSNPTTGGTGPGAPSDEGTECNDVNKCFAGFVCDLKSGTGVCRKAKSCKDLTCKTGTVCQQLFGLDAQCYGTNDCTVTPCNPSQTCVSIGVPAPFCRNTLTCDDIACDIKSNCRAGSQGVDAVCIPPCADNEHWDACGGCDSSCAVPDRICNTLCNPSNGACRCNVPLVRGPDGKCIDKTQCPGGPGIPSPTPTPTEPTPSAPTPPPSPPPTEPPGPTPPPQACNLDCVIGKHCVVTPTGPMCVDNGPQACNLDCKVGFHCVVEPSGPTCVPNVPPVCNIDCKVGTHCVVEPTGPVCVPNGPQVCNIDCKIGFHCIVLPAGPTCVPNEPQVCNLDCKDGTKCVVEPTGPVCVPIEPTPVPVGSENYYGQCKAQNCPEHLQCALLFDKRMYCNSDLKCACDCEPQEVCVLEDVVCVTAPCNPVPHCYGPPEPTPPTVPTLPPSPEPTLAPSPTVPSVSPTPGPIPGPSPSPPTVPTVPPTPGPDYYDQCKAQNCPEHLQCALLPDKRMYCNLDTKCVCDCATHEVCVLEDVICVAAPCNPVPHCYGPSGPNPPTVPTLPPSPEPTLAPSPSPPVPTTGPTSGPSPSPPTAPTVPSVPPTPGPGNYYDQCKAQGCPEHLQCALLPDKRMNCNADLKCVCDCEPDHVCILEDVVCVKAPCDPIPHCHSPNGEVTSVPTPPPTPKPPTYPLEKNYYKQCRALHCPSPQKCILEQWLELHCGISPGVKCNCAPDQLCVLQVVTCIQAPCPPIPICYSNPGKIGGPSPPPLPPPATPGPPSPIAPIDSNYYKQCKALKCPRKQECVLESWLELHCGIVPGTKCNCQPDQVCVIEVVVCCCPPCNPIAQCYSKPENPTPPPGEPTPPEKICDKHCPSGTVCLFGPGDVQKCVQETSWVTYTTLPPSSSQCKPPFPPCAPRHTCHRYPDGTQGCVEACEPPCTGGATCIPDDNGTPVCQHGTETPTNPPCHLPCPIPQTCAIDANGDPYCKGNPPCVLPCPSGEICDLNSSGKPYCKSQCDPPCSENHICRPGFEGTPICQPGFPTPTPSPTPTPTSPVPSYRPCVPPLCAPGHTCQRNKDGSQICVEQPCPLPCNPPSHVCVVTDSGPQCVEVPPPPAQTVRPCDRECPYGEHCESDGKDEVCAPNRGDPNPIPTRDPNEPTTAPHLICPHGCLIGQHCDITENGAECVSDPPTPGGPCGGFPCFTDTTTVKSEVDLPVTPIIEPIPTCAMAGLCIDGASCIDTPTGPVCAPKCSDNEEVNHCGNLCENKCASLCQPQACPKICGPPKCACKKDRYRDPKSGKCVKEKQCPKCPTTGGYPTGGTKVPPVCNILCEIGTHCEVKPTGPICVPDDKNCPKHSTYSQCGNHCEGKCATAFSGPQLCSFVCGPAACACDKDYYRNDDNECVTKDECNNNGCGPNTEPVNPCAFTTCLAPSDCIVVDGNAKCVAPGTASGHPYA